MHSMVKWAALGVSLSIVALTVITCAHRNVYSSQEENPMTERKLAEVLKEHTKELMSFPGVVGTALGLCDGRPCIKVYVVKRTPESDQKILNSLTGYPVGIEETGHLRALPENHN